MSMREPRMDNTPVAAQQPAAASGPDAAPLDALSADEVALALSLVLPRLPLDARACAACVDRV
jgi:hypothetical protein